MKLNSYGDAKEVNVSRTYTAKAAIYNLDGSKVKDLEYGDIYVADKAHLGKAKEWTIQTSTVIAGENLKVGDLDNKIIRVVITTENPVQTADTDITEPLIGNQRCPYQISCVRKFLWKPKQKIRYWKPVPAVQAIATKKRWKLRLSSGIRWIWQNWDRLPVGDIYPAEGNN